MIAGTDVMLGGIRLVEHMEKIPALSPAVIELDAPLFYLIIDQIAVFSAFY